MSIGELLKTERKKVNISTLVAKKKKDEKAVFITAYDYPFSYLADQAGIDMILIGDSLGMTTLGHETTLPVTMEDMIRHSQAVKRGSKYAFLIGDMPFMSYQPSDRDAILNAGRFISEAGCDAVKLEGGRRVKDRVRAIVDAGIIVMGHLGLTPQNAAQMGGFRVQGKTVDQFEELLQDALALQEAGAALLLLEALPSEVASLIRARLSIPVYGIGAGGHMDGQLLIIHDLLGLFHQFTPKFVKKYASLGDDALQALQEYVSDVRSKKFPSPEHDYEINSEALEQIRLRAGRPCG